MRLERLKYLTKWALWVSQWQGVTRSSDMLMPKGKKSRKSDPEKDTNVGRITWEDVEPRANGRCKIGMRWKLKQSKTDPSGASFREDIRSRRRPERHICGICHFESPTYAPVEGRLGSTQHVHFLWITIQGRRSPCKAPERIQQKRWKRQAYHQST